MYSIIIIHPTNIMYSTNIQIKIDKITAYNKYNDQIMQPNTPSMSVIDILDKLPETEQLELAKMIFYDTPQKMVDILVNAIQFGSKSMYHYVKYIDNVNELDSEYGSTPIMFAAQSGNVDMVKLLLDMGASVADMANKSALVFALWGERDNNYRCAKILIEAGASTDPTFLKNCAVHLDKYYEWLSKQPVEPVIPAESVVPIIQLTTLPIPVGNSYSFGDKLEIIV